MTNDELDAIEARANAECSTDVPALLAEVRRLRVELGYVQHKMRVDDAAMREVVMAVKTTKDREIKQLRAELEARR